MLLRPVCSLGEKLCGHLEVSGCVRDDGLSVSLYSLRVDFNYLTNSGEIMQIKC